MVYSNKKHYIETNVNSLFFILQFANLYHSTDFEDIVNDIFKDLKFKIITQTMSPRHDNNKQNDTPLTSNKNNYDNYSNKVFYFNNTQYSSHKSI